METKILFTFSTKDKLSEMVRWFKKMKGRKPKGIHFNNEDYEKFKMFVEIPIENTDSFFLVGVESASMKYENIKIYLDPICNKSYLT